jgi:glycosyltransferase involved in cell wall biosynthesis
MTEPDILLDTRDGDLPLISIITPVHNQEHIIAKNLSATVAATTETAYDMIIIIDACSDETEARVLEWANDTPFPTNFRGILVLRSPAPLFETAADNVGFRLARGAYLLEIQADIYITEQGYNLRMLKPFQRFSDVIGVSGRCAHAFFSEMGVGKLGALVEREELPAGIEKDCFYVAETCNRGPLMLDAEKTRQLGFLDEDSFFLDNSDHDLFARAYFHYKWICGYVPIHFKSPLQDGSTRKPRDPANQAVFQEKQRTCHQRGFLFKYMAANPPRRAVSVVRLHP